MRDLEDVALAFDMACRDAGVSYAFMGGIAVIAWGQPRTTMDVDALVSMEEDQAEALAEAAGRHGLTVSARDPRDSTQDGTHATAFDADSALHVDVKIARSADEIEEIGSAVDVSFATGHLRIVGPEHTVAFKLRFGSDRDLADAQSILTRRAGRMDVVQLRDLCERMGVGDALQRLQRRIDSTPE